MKFKEQPRIETLYKCTNLVFSVDTSEHSKAFNLWLSINKLDLSKEYTIEVKHVKNKRSLDQNAYMWALIEEIAYRLGRSNKDVYRHYITDFGVGEVVPIKKEAISRWCENWSRKGVGWITEDLGECKNIKGYHNIKSYYGSSTYNTEEMSRIIDAIIFDCKEQGINIPEMEQQ